MNVENSIEKCKEFMEKFVKRGYVINFESFGKSSDAPLGIISVNHVKKRDVKDTRDIHIELKTTRSYELGDLISGDGPMPIKLLATVVYDYHILNRNVHPEEYTLDGEYKPPKDKPTDKPTDKQTA